MHVASWRVAYRGLLPDAVLDGLSVHDRARRWAERLGAPAPRSWTLLAVDGAAGLGFASTGPARDADERALRFSHRQGWAETGGTKVHLGPEGDVALPERELHRTVLY